MTTPNRRTTERGFPVYDEFTDSYGSEVRVRKSSCATAPRVWIFTQKFNKNEPPHLTIEQAKRVRDALDTFIAENKDEPDNTAEIHAAMLEAFNEKEARPDGN